MGEDTIILEKDAVPYSISVARWVSISMRKKVKAELGRVVQTHVIRKINKPTKRCSGLSSAVKVSEDIRICIDFTKLNKYI